MTSRFWASANNQGISPAHDFFALSSIQPMEKGNTILGTQLSSVGQAVQYTVHTARGPSSALQVTLAAIYWDPTFGERAVGNDLTVQIAIEIPAASGNFSNLTVGGSSTITVTNGTSVDTDAFPHSFADGDTFGLWVRAVGANVPYNWPAGTAGSMLYTDEGAIYNASTSSTPTNSVADDHSRERRLGVVVGIFGRKSINATSVAVVGDSQQSFATSNLETNSQTSDHVRGDMVRTISQDYPCINLGIGGTDPAGMNFVPNTVLTMLAKRANVVVDAYGINYFNNKAFTGAIALAYRNRWLPRWNGKRVIEATLSPITTSTDSWATETNQTTNGHSADIDTYNTTIRGLSQFIERRTLVQGTNTDKWLTDGVTAKLNTVDGLHLSLNAVGLIMATRSTIKGQIDAAVTPRSVSQPSVTLSGGTITSGYLASGTAALNGILPCGAPATAKFKFVATAATSLSLTVLGMATVTINTNVLRVQDGSGTLTSGTTAITDGVEHTVVIVATTTGYSLYLDGNSTAEITRSYTINQVQTNKQLSLTVSSGNNKVRALSVWNYAYTSPPDAPTGTETGLIAYWPLSTDLTGIIGPGLPQ